MSTARRAYDLLRGYVHQEWERIQGLEHSDALEELDRAIDATRTDHVPPRSDPVKAVQDAKTVAREILGVGPNDSFTEIRKACEKLNKRSDPTRFPTDSAAAKEAAEIQRKVHWAYSILSEGIDGTEKRFRSLEID